ncbi:hypothetical protein LPJ55_000725 [Coemansia sp. RSA 990]|nr:transferase family-domain-containing protein [Coemansia mojavensis]KAJ1875369.1 hypothetical protein LPJ55_000725 [Coemansia sp. RSA 990]
MTPGGLVVSLGADCPPVNKHIDTQHTVAQMIADDFASQPSVMTNTPIECSPTDPWATLDLVYMEDGVGLAFSISHAVTDLGGSIRIAQEWAKMTRSMPLAPYELNMDRQWFWSQLLQESPPFKSMHHTEQLPTISQEQSHVYRLSFSPQAIDVLKTRRQSAAVSIGSFITAILWRAFARSHTEFVHLGISLTTRIHPRYADYWGNTSTIKYICQPVQDIINWSIADIANKAQEAVRTFTPAEFLYIVNQYVENDVAIENKLMVINVSQFPFYDVDFGFGKPIKVVWPPSLPSGAAMLYPRSSDGGIDIYIKVCESVIQNIKIDQLISDLVSVTECNK